VAQEPHTDALDEQLLRVDRGRCTARAGEENKTFLMAYLIVLICSWVLCWAPAVNWILIIAQFVMNIIVLNDLAHTFGKESAYTIGLVLLGIVFWPMLGFGESEPVDLEDDSDTDYEVL